jgi:hypothetical protein
MTSTLRGLRRWMVSFQVIHIHIPVVDHQQMQMKKQPMK